MALTIAFDAIPDSQLRKTLGKHGSLESWSLSSLLCCLYLQVAKLVTDH